MNRHQRIKVRSDQIRAAKEELRRTVEVGRSYVVQGYWTGTFKARVEWVSAGCDPLVRLVVLDAMRRRPALHCDFPECLENMGHEGDHKFDEDSRSGMTIELAFRNARFLPTVFEEFQPRQQTNEDKTA